MDVAVGQCQFQSIGVTCLLRGRRCWVASHCQASAAVHAVTYIAAHVATHVAAHAVMHAVPEWLAEPQ